jgi:hypothetical protein
MLDDLIREVSSLQDEIMHLNSPELEQILVNKVGRLVGQEVLTHLRPLFILFWNLSSRAATPGDILKNQLRVLEARPQGEVDLNTGLASNWFSAGLNAGTTLPMSNVTTRGGNGLPSKECINFLEAQLKELQDEMGLSSVKVGVVTFVSQTQMKAWMDRNSVPLCSSLFFLDAMSMLALMHSGSESAKAATEFALVTQKVGYSSPDEALVVTSFSLELPEAFGSLPNLGVAQDSRILPMLPTFKEWDSGVGRLQWLEDHAVRQAHRVYSPDGKLLPHMFVW